MRWTLRSTVAVLVLCASLSCGATPQIVGDWSGRIAPNHFDYLNLRLTQDGKYIRGTACYEIVPGSTSGGIAWKDGTINGVYPKIQVVGPSSSLGWTFTGEFQDDGTLAGQWHNNFTSPYHMGLGRGLSPNGAPGCF